MAKKRAPAKKRARTERRVVERDAVKLAKARLELAALERGGSAERPIEVSSASIVEPHALKLECVVCGGVTRLEEHAAMAPIDEGGGRRSLRVVRVRCSRCGVPRELFFRIGTTLAN